MTPEDENDPHERATDEGLQKERDRTDTELAERSADAGATAESVVLEARDRADSVLRDARDLEDRKLAADRGTRYERGREDAKLAAERSGADTAARDENEQRRVALASLLAFERAYTDQQLEIEREHADRLLASREDFMAMVSHDLRSLLGGIALSADLLKQVHQYENPLEQVTSYADRILRFSARMTRLVGDLMDVASIEAGKLALLTARRNVALMLRDAADAFAPAAAMHGIALRCDGNEAGFANIDHERILQVLTNLVGNALKFTEKGGRITIRIDRRDDEIVFSVADTGTGIPAELLDKIFERYFQSRHGDRRGLGLGLFISKCIVEGHGGRIWAESTPGHGSTVSFTVPAVD
jgi:signal transduction histidine kinase